VLTNALCAQKATEGGKACSLCRCWKSATFPLCNGSHNSHNEQCHDNAGPAVIKQTGAPPPSPKKEEVADEDKDLPVRCCRDACAQCVVAGTRTLRFLLRVTLTRSGGIAPDAACAQLITLAEVQKHNSQGDSWTVIHGKVWDITEWIPEHPGGAAVLSQYAGKVKGKGGGQGRAAVCAVLHLHSRLHSRDTPLSDPLTIQPYPALRSRTRALTACTT